MSHVDDGMLHALLDGALAATDARAAEHVELHLAACPDCRARLDEAARLRDEASALMATAAPRAVVTPPFDAIRARAAQAPPSESARPRRRAAFLASSPFNRVAWAASVVFAVGLGWLLHDTVGESEAFAVRERAGDIAAGRDLPSADVPYVEEAAPAPGASTGAASGGAPGAPPAARPGALRAESSAGEAAVAEVLAGEAGAGEGGAGVAGDPAPLGFQTLSPPPPAAPPERRAARAAEYDVAAEDAAGQGVAGESEAMAAAPAPAPADAAPAGWNEVTEADLDRLLEGELIRIDGARVVAAAVRGVGATLEVRTVQMTARGEALTLVQSPLAPNEASALADPDAADGLTVRLGDWSVTISGRVSRERLEQLARELR